MTTYAVSMKEALADASVLIGKTVTVEVVRNKVPATITMDVHYAQRLGEGRTVGLNGVGVTMVGRLTDTGAEHVQSVYGNATFNLTEGTFELETGSN